MKLSRRNMTREICLCLCWGLLFPALGCARDDSEAEHESPSTGVQRSIRTQALTKGSVGATTGDSDYCDDPSNPCVSGEGDCDTNDQCKARERVGGTRMMWAYALLPPAPTAHKMGMRLTSTVAGAVALAHVLLLIRMAIPTTALLPILAPLDRGIVTPMMSASLGWFVSKAGEGTMG